MVIMINMDIQNAYNKWADIYDTDINLTRDLDSDVTCNLLANRQFDSILELGCGTGKNTVFLTQIGERVQALDFSEGMIQKAKKKVKAGHVRFEIADLTKRWPCEDSAYDLITCNLVLEHIQDLSHIFSEAVRTLRPNGIFLINELHPFKQYGGSKARFENRNEIIQVDSFVHHISDFMQAAESNRLSLDKFNEYWHEADKGRPPRLVSFIFMKNA